MARLILRNHLLAGVVYKTKHVVIKKIQEGKKEDKCYIIGTGGSLSVDASDNTLHHDPGMKEFSIKMNEDYTVYVFYFTFEASGLWEAAKGVANFANDLWFDNEYEKIILVGHSKAGICAFMAASYCNFPINLVTISTPFYGTVMVDRKKAEAILKFRFLIFIHRNRFSNHKVDKDITPSSRLANPLPYPKCEYINIKSRLRGLADCKDALDLFLLFLNRHMQLAGDGIVPTSSQSLTNVKEITIFSSHARSLRDGLEMIEKENLI